jgi:hypothetical protein
MNHREFGRLDPHALNMSLEEVAAEEELRRLLMEPAQFPESHPLRSAIDAVGVVGKMRPKQMAALAAVGALFFRAGAAYGRRVPEAPEE